MILFARQWQAPSWLDTDRAAASLGLFAGHPASSHRDGPDFFAELTAPRARPGANWRAAHSPGGLAVLLHGWIDNAAVLAATLDAPRLNHAQLYGAAIERWGMAADRHVVGAYAAIVRMPDGRVRLSRSPWESPPLFVHRDRNVLVACSLTRPIFAAGLERQLRASAIDEMLTMRLPDDRASMFERVEQIPHGTVAIASRETLMLDRWYDPLSLPETEFESDEAYVEAGNALLAEAVAAALRHCEKPGLALSGGLDSAIVGDEILRQLPDGQTLPSFTFCPLPDWDGVTARGGFGDDWPWVEAFAAMHPALRPYAVDNRDRGFDDASAAYFAATEHGHPSRVLGTVYHGVYQAARDKGCNWLLTASLGSATFSTDAPWALSEFLGAGRWQQARRLIKSSGDGRNGLRVLVAEGIAPRLPAPLRSLYYRAAERWRGGDAHANPFLAKDGRLARYAKREAIERNFSSTGLGRSREDVIRQQYYSFGLGSELALGYEQVFGIRHRDVTAYRPLIEFAAAIPTDQFVRDGERRWLARRMARGRMPEAQRTNRLYGQHNVDWHARMTPRLAELKAEVRRIADHPELGSLLDTDAMMAQLDAWPDGTPQSDAQVDRLRFFLPAAIYVRRYVDAMTGRNAA